MISVYNFVWGESTAEHRLSRRWMRLRKFSIYVLIKIKFPELIIVFTYGSSWRKCSLSSSYWAVPLNKSPMKNTENQTIQFYNNNEHRIAVNAIFFCSSLENKQRGCRAWKRGWSMVYCSSGILYTVLYMYYCSHCPNMVSASFLFIFIIFINNITCTLLHLYQYKELL